jgi:diacylglycerol kinase (ATP)
MDRRIIYIINPISGTRKKADLRDYVEAATRKRGIPFQIFPSVASGDYSFLRPIIAEEKITDVVIAGGDGTVSQVVASLMDCPVNFGIIPCGSGNGLALAAGISKKPEQALQTVFTGKPQLTDGFYINGQFACMLCGLGFDAQVAHEFAHQPKRGLGTYASLVTKNFFSAKPYQFHIRAGAMEFDAEAFFISIANSNQFGNNFTIAPDALLADGLIDIVIVKKSAKPVLLYTLVKQILSGHVKKIENSLSNPVIYFQATELQISNPGQAPLHIDGDPAEMVEEIHVKVAPSCFRLIQP